MRVACFDLIGRCLKLVLYPHCFCSDKKLSSTYIISLYTWVSLSPSMSLKVGTIFWKDPRDGKQQNSKWVPMIGKLGLNTPSSFMVIKRGLFIKSASRVIPLWQNANRPQ